MTKGNYFLLVLLLLISLTTTTFATEQNFVEKDKYNNLRFGNDYIVIVVNMDNNGLGRFAIETTGGAPFRNNDDNKPLVYGRPKPWTSYTTLKVDGDNYVFGGSTGRRAGKSGIYGEVISGPEVINGNIQTTTKINDLNVKQILSIVKSSTTGLYDSVQIKYRIENTGNKGHQVGLRIMLDTMLGQNDGAPFRIGSDAVTTDKLYLREDLPSFWQAFDSISSPQVTSQGTFLGQGVTPPDKVYFSDWGSLADGCWDFDFNPGEEFIRKGEYETDSAIALYWEPKTIEPGEVLTYVTNYGLGGITIVPGLLSLGVTSPAEVVFDTKDKTFPIIAYIENTSEITAKDVNIKLNLPSTFKVNNNVIFIGDLEPGDISQQVWHVRSNSNNIPSKITYKVQVEAKNTDSNQVSREIKFVGPPILDASINLLDKLKVIKGKLEPNPFKIEAILRNKGGSSLYDVSSELILPPGLILSSKEITKKYLGYLEPGESIKVRWLVKALNVDGLLPFAVNVVGLNGYSKTEIEKIELPELSPLIYLNKKEIKDYITIDIVGENIDGIDNLSMTLIYNAKSIKPIYVSRGNIFLKNGKLLPWSEPNLAKEGIIKFDYNIPAEASSGILASIHFKIIGKGLPSIKWGSGKFIDEKGKEIEVSLNGY